MKRLAILLFLTLSACAPTGDINQILKHVIETAAAQSTAFAVSTTKPTSISTPTGEAMETLRPALTFTPTLTAGPWMACSDAYISRLHVNDRVYVSYQPALANRVRSQPNVNSKIVGSIKPGEQVKILDGPSCSNQWVWWYVRSDVNGLKGWTSEGDSKNYWLVPLP